MRMVVEPQPESLGRTIALLWLTSRKQPGKNCRTRQCRFAWREREVAGPLENFHRNLSIESEAASGTLLVTPLLGADGNVYAVAQGSVAISGFQAEGEAAKIVRGVPTVGRIANGAIIEREIEFALNRLPNVRLALRNADFTTAKRIASAVNDFLGTKTAEPIDPSTVQLSIPKEFKGNVVALLTEIEQLQVEPDIAAKIIIDERSGIIVMGRDVRVATVAVAQGNLTVSISESPQVSQPNPLSRGRTVVTPNTRVGVQEDGKKLALVKDGVSLQQLVDGLNGLGIGPRDLIGILQAIKAAGAIEADIEVM
jgi:flagellar P-ring protein precursor FlgI